MLLDIISDLSGRAERCIVEDDSDLLDVMVACQQWPPNDKTFVTQLGLEQNPPSLLLNPLQGPGLAVSVM